MTPARHSSRFFKPGVAQAVNEAQAKSEVAQARMRLRSVSTALGDSSAQPAHRLLVEVIVEQKPEDFLQTAQKLVGEQLAVVKQGMTDLIQSTNKSLEGLLGFEPLHSVLKVLDVPKLRDGNNEAVTAGSAALSTFVFVPAAFQLLTLHFSPPRQPLAPLRFFLQIGIIQAVAWLSIAPKDSQKP